MIQLYHYIHCPFCIRVRMALGLLNIQFESIALPYNDEATPLRLMNKKMLPIVKFDGGEFSNESLDIIKRADIENVLQNQESDNSELDQLLSIIGKDLHSLCMPYWMWTPEFNQTSREYFQKKKEVKRGPFKKLIQDKHIYIENLEKTLVHVESKLTPFYDRAEFTIKDIMLASHLWGMYIFPEFQFSLGIHEYLQSVKEKTKFEYHQDFWI